MANGNINVTDTTDTSSCIRKGYVGRRTMGKICKPYCLLWYRDKRGTSENVTKVSTTATSSFIPKGVGKILAKVTSTIDAEKKGGRSEKGS